MLVLNFKLLLTLIPSVPPGSLGPHDRHTAYYGTIFFFGFRGLVYLVRVVRLHPFGTADKFLLCVRSLMTDAYTVAICWALPVLAYT